MDIMMYGLAKKLMKKDIYQELYLPIYTMSYQIPMQSIISLFLHVKDLLRRLVNLVSAKVRM